MDEDILIEVKLDDREINRQIDSIGRRLKTSLDAALGGSASGGAGTDRTSRVLRDQEAAAVRLAQAQARLSAASGNLRGAENTLSSALSNVTRQTLATISAQTQLVNVKQRAIRATQDLANSMANLGTRLTFGVTAPLTALAVAAVKTATDFDSLKRGLISVSGSSEAAEKQLISLKEVAKLPGLGFKEAIQGSINLQAVGFSAERSEKILRTFGNALATVGRGKSELDGVIRALSQIESKGKVSAEEINQLAERVPQIRKAIVAAFGTADTEIIQKAKISTRQFIDAVVFELDKLPKITGGARNTFENLKDSIEQSLLPLGNKILENLIPAIDKLSPKILGLVEGFGKLSSGTQQFILGAGLAAIAAGPLIGALANILSLLTQIRNLGGVGSAIGGALSGAGGLLARVPVGLGVAALGGIGVGIGTALSEEDLNRRIAAGNFNFENRLNPQDLQGNQAFIQIGPGGVPILPPGFKSGLDLTGVGGLAVDPTGKVVRRKAGQSTLDAVQEQLQIDAKALAAANSKRQGQKSELQKASDDLKEITEKVNALKRDEGKLFEAMFKLAQARAEFEALNDKLKNKAFRAFLTATGQKLPVELPNVATTAQLLGVRVTPTGAPGAIPGPTGIPLDFDALKADASRNRADILDQQLRIQEVQLQNQVNRGLLTEAQGQTQLAAVRRAARDELIATLDAERQSVGLNSIRGLQITEEIERLRFLGVELSTAERFMRGFGSATETVGDAFERFGQNVARALTNTKDLLNSLKNSVLQLFNDLLGQSLQNLVRSALAPLLGLTGGVLGGGAGNIFRTPSTFPASGAASAFQSIATAISGGGGPAIPASVSSGTFGGVLPRPNAGFQDAIRQAIFPGGGGGGSRGGIFSRAGFGQSLQSLADNAPLLGLMIGASLGGQSTLGKVLGGAGGLLTSTFISTTLGAPGALGSLAPALFSNPITAIIGAGLLVGSIFLGKASQRRKDEEASGQMLTQALQGIEQLAIGIGADQIEGAQARILFDQILSNFRQQISGLKTRSVVESRLRNQVNDLEGVYQARIVPEIAAQQKRRADATRFAFVHSRLIPEFSTGGVAPGGLALLHHREMVLTPSHQSAIRFIAGSDIFERVGVPGVQQDARFDQGGIFSARSFDQPIEITLDAQVVISEKTATGIYVVGGRSSTGRAVTVNNVKVARTNREL